MFAQDHARGVDVVALEGLAGPLHRGLGQGAAAAQDPREVHVEEPQDVGARVHQRRVDVVRGEDPVRGVGQHCGGEGSVQVYAEARGFITDLVWHSIDLKLD